MKKLVLFLTVFICANGCASKNTTDSLPGSVEEKTASSGGTDEGPDTYLYPITAR